MPECFKSVLTKEFFELNHITLKKSCPTIARELGCSLPTVIRYLRKHGFWKKRRVREGNIAKQRFGSLVAIEEVSGKESGKQRRLWRCKCDCGGETLSRLSHLLDGKAKSCGCMSWNTGANHPGYSGTMHIPKSHWNAIRRSAAEREHEFTISIEDAEKQFKKQDGKCALTDIPLVVYSRTSSVEWTASLDRRDSRLGYTKENIQWIHKDVNRMKWHFTEEYFVEMCRAIVVHYDSKVCAT